MNTTIIRSNQTVSNSERIFLFYFVLYMANQNKKVRFSENRSSSQTNKINIKWKYLPHVAHYFPLIGCFLTSRHWYRCYLLKPTTPFLSFKLYTFPSCRAWRERQTLKMQDLYFALSHSIPFAGSGDLPSEWASAFFGVSHSNGTETNQGRWRPVLLCFLHRIYPS